MLGGGGSLFALHEKPKLLALDLFYLVLLSLEFGMFVSYGLIV